MEYSSIGRKKVELSNELLAELYEFRISVVYKTLLDLLEADISTRLLSLGNEIPKRSTLLKLSELHGRKAILEWLRKLPEESKLILDKNKK